MMIPTAAMRVAPTCRQHVQRTVVRIHNVARTASHSRTHTHSAATTRTTLRQHGTTATAADAPPRHPPAVYVYNSLTGRKEDVSDILWPCSPASVPISMYVCGPTVYDHAHIGHARTYVLLDLFRRSLARWSPRPVAYVQGVTDVDDKIVRACASSGTRFPDLARYFEACFVADMVALGVAPPTRTTRVTEHIPDIIQYIARIMERGLAYVAKDGVYMDVAALGDAYGKLRPAGREGDGDEHNVAPDTVAREGKRDPRDFALWKLIDVPEAAREATPAWPSPWGPGRPGWHIECSAMTHTSLGPRLDFHAGGIDLAFPHHCNEIAQSEAHNAAPWVRVFMHTGHLHIHGRKMSKSLKNFITVKDVLGAGDSVSRRANAEAFRMFCVMYHYRSNVTYSPDRMHEAHAVLKRIHDAAACLRAAKSRFQRTRSALADIVATGLPLSQQVKAFMQQVDGSGNSRWTAALVTEHEAAMDCMSAADAALRDDFDTPTALRHALSLATIINRSVTPSSSGAAVPEEYVDAMYHALSTCTESLGVRVGGSESSDNVASAAGVPVDVLASFRDRVRAEAVALLRTTKTAGKLAASDKTVSDCVAGAQTSAKTLLAECDAVRDLLAKQHGLTLRDGATK